jgi:hypothetical protein
MLDFMNVWLPQIIGYAELVAEENNLRKAWLQGDLTGTVVDSYDELIIQVLENALEMRLELPAQLAGFVNLRDALNNFILAFRELDAWVEAQSPQPTAEKILASEFWGRLREQAAAVSKSAAQAGFRSSAV